MAINIKAILDELGATGDDRNLLEQYFTKNEPLAAKLNEWREGGLRQSDYTRRMEGLKATETAKLAELATQEQNLTQIRENMNAQFLQAQKDREAAEVRAAAMQAHVKRLQAEWNLPEAAVKDILDGAAPAPASAGPAPSVNGPVNFDASQFVSRKDYDELKSLALKLPTLATKLPGMRAQHQALFGECPPDFEEKLLAEAQKQQRPIETVWDNVYGVTEKRNAANEARIRADERAKAETEFKAKYSQSNVNPVTALRPDLNGQNSPIFHQESGKYQRPGVTPAMNRLTSVQNAVQAFSQGKYRRPEVAHQE